MRIRSIKPEFWASDDIAALDWPTRLLFIGLWSYVDDNGVGRDNERLICAALFPQDPPETLATVSGGLQKLSDRGLITRYEVDGKPYLHISAWAKHQRIDKPGNARYPAPVAGQTVFRDTPATPSGESPEIPAPGAVEQGNRGEEDQGEGEEKTSALAVVAPPARDDVERICEHLADRIEANGSKRPTITKGWRDDIRLMLDKDGRSEAEAMAAINWCQNDDFWRANILSPTKLRAKFDQMRLQAEAQQKKATTPRKGDIDWSAAIARADARTPHHAGELA